MAQLGCTVRAFDPDPAFKNNGNTITPNLYLYHGAIGDAINAKPPPQTLFNDDDDDYPTDTLKGLMGKYGDEGKSITYLKID